jgi:hypothetical protein
MFQGQVFSEKGPVLSLRRSAKEMVGQVEEIEGDIGIGWICEMNLRFARERSGKRC